MAALQRYSQASSAHRSHFTGILRTDPLPVLMSMLMEKFFDEGDRLFSSLCRVRLLLLLLLFFSQHSCSLAFKKTIVSIVSPLYCPGSCGTSVPSPPPPPSPALNWRDVCFSPPRLVSCQGARFHAETSDTNRKLLCLESVKLTAKALEQSANVLNETQIHRDDVS